MESTGSPRKIITNLLLLALSICLVLIVGEVYSRYRAYKLYRTTFEYAVKKGESGGLDEQVEARKAGSVGLGNILKVSDNEKLIYELIPNLKAVYEMQYLKTNSEGLTCFLL